MNEEVQTPVEAPVETETATQPVDILRDDGKFNDAWRTALPEDLGNHSIWQKYDNPIDMVKGTINAQSHIGKKAEEFWTSEAEEDIARKNEIMGVPSSFDQYNITAPEGFEVEEADINDFKEKMFDLGLNNEQAQAIADYQLNNFVDMIDSFEQNNNEQLDVAEKELREIWKGDQFDYQMSKVADALDFLGLGEWKDDPKFANDPKFIKGIAENLLPLLDNDEIIQGNMNNSYATIQDELSEIEDEIYSYEGDMNDYGYTQLIKRRGELLEKIS